MSFNIFKPNSNSVGIGLRYQHYDYVITNKPDVPWFEVHGENFFARGGPSIDFLKKVRDTYPLSLHCVGLSLGSVSKVNVEHLQNIKHLNSVLEPFLISDHISWSGIEGVFLNDLLPIPYTKESLNQICSNIAIVQDSLNRELLLENPSTYLSFKMSDMTEEYFINTMSNISGCKILLDINNIYVSSVNNNKDPYDYINNIDKDIVREIHLAGHFKKSLSNGNYLLIDTHDNLVCEEVWNLYKKALTRFPDTPTLIEWDQNIPEFDVLLSEAEKAYSIIGSLR